MNLLIISAVYIVCLLILTLWTKFVTYCLEPALKDLIISLLPIIFLVPALAVVIMYLSPNN